MRLIGEGMTAKIYEYSSNSIAKVFNAGLPMEYAEYEKNLLSIISDLDIKTARYIDYQFVDGQPAIIMERIHGSSFFTVVVNSPLDVLGLLKRFISSQRMIHSKTTEKLPSEKTRFKAQLLRSGLDVETKLKISYLIDRLPERNSVCHGDFHFGNIIDSSDGLYTIDWMNSYAGNPIGDIFRSYLMLKSPYNPLPIHGMKKLAFMTYKSLIASIYLSHAIRKFKLSKKDRITWLGIIAAVRLCDNVPNEREWLLTMIKKCIQLA